MTKGKWEMGPVKHDDGKPKLDLIPYEFLSRLALAMERAIDEHDHPCRLDLVPVEAIAGAAIAMGYGAEKYGDDNWCRGEGLDQVRLYRAALRHINQANLLTGQWEPVDADSGLFHMWHAAASLFMCEALRERRRLHGDRISTGERMPKDSGSPD